MTYTSGLSVELHCCDIATLSLATRERTRYFMSLPYSPRHDPTDEEVEEFHGTARLAAHAAEMYELLRDVVAHYRPDLENEELDNCLVSIVCLLARIEEES